MAGPSETSLPSGGEAPAPASALASDIQTGVTAAVGVGEIAASVQQAISRQTGILNEVLAGMEEFLTLAPKVAGAVDPAIAVPAQLTATGLMALISGFQAWHSANVAAAVKPATTSPPAA